MRQVIYLRIFKESNGDQSVDEECDRRLYLRTKLELDKWFDEARYEERYGNKTSKRCRKEYETKA